MTRAWLVGARGMLGQAVARHLTAANVDFVATDMDIDITDATAVNAFAADSRVTHILNCAAYTAVDRCESEEALATTVNGTGAANIARAAARLGAVALHISTDYVFDGSATKPYREDAPCSPLGAYGRSKWAGEQAFFETFSQGPTDGRGIVVRTSWLFGRDGKNFVSTMLQLFEKREELGVVGDQFGRPTYCEDLAEAMLALSGLTRAKPAVQGVYHFANSGELSWHGFAQGIWQAARNKGKEFACKEVRAIGTADYPTPAKRPAYSVLDTTKVARALGKAPRAWQAALDDYLNMV